MSDVRRLSKVDDLDHSSKIVPELDASLKEELIEIPGAIEYIEKLQRTLKQLVKKIRKLKKRISVSSIFL